MVITAALTATGSVGHLKQRTWQTTWRDIDHQLAELEAYYVARPAVSNGSVRLMVEHLLESFRELGDRLWRTTDLSESAVKTFVHGNPDLEVCDGFAQASKRNFRRKRRFSHDPLTAWIERESTDGAVVIRWENQSGTVTGTDDALALARRCVAAWRGYLTHHGVT